jgi:hypothetical protein
MALRKAGRLANGIVWTIEQEKRDSWPRAWKWLEPRFADCDPKTVEPEHFLRVDERTGQATGLVPEIDRSRVPGHRPAILDARRPPCEP